MKPDQPARPAIPQARAESGKAEHGREGRDRTLRQNEPVAGSDVRIEAAAATEDGAIDGDARSAVVAERQPGAVWRHGLELQAEVLGLTHRTKAVEQRAGGPDAETRFSDGNVGGCSFRDAFAHRRCVFPVNGWYEWQRRGGAKIPHLIDREDGGTVHLAGIWETWTSGDGSDGFAVLTTEPRLEIAAVHDRQPAVLDIEQVQEWLCPGTGRNRLRELAGQRSTERFRIRRVSRAVNNRRNDSPDLLATAG